MNKYFFVLVFFSLIGRLNAQYWFGPKIGFQKTDYIYEDMEYKDTYDISTDYNYHGGIAVTYLASRQYSVHGELNYEKYQKDLTNRPEFESVTSKSVNHFLSLPLLLRFNYEISPVMFYLNGGVKLSYWISGNGHLGGHFLEEGAFPTRDYKVIFEEQESFDNTRPYLENPNRFQYSLVLGTGMYFHIVNNSHIMVDLRYSFGHSNMGSNGSFDFDFDTYEENFEYRHNTLSLSLGYMLELNVESLMRGKSTFKSKKKK